MALFLLSIHRHAARRYSCGVLLNGEPSVAASPRLSPCMSPGEGRRRAGLPARLFVIIAAVHLRPGSEGSLDGGFLRESLRLGRRAICHRETSAGRALDLGAGMIDRRAHLTAESTLVPPHRERRRRVPAVRTGLEQDTYTIAITHRSTAPPICPSSLTRRPWRPRQSRASSIPRSIALPLATRHQLVSKKNAHKAQISR